MQVRLLGPVDVVVDGATRPVSGLRRKAVLSALALHPRRIVSADRLVHMVWGDTAPSNVANALQTNVSYLRGVLGDRSAIRTHPPGYVLDLDAEATDIETADRLMSQGMQAADPALRAGRLQTAVALWRGPALCDVAGLAWYDEEAQRLEQLLLRARKALVESRLALGQHDQVIAELESLCREYPLHEQIHGLRMLALYRAGRQAEALTRYHELRRALDEDLGISPSQALRDLEVAILCHDPSLNAPASATEWKC
jgi:DNA-binding SARP family transcriptional activator